MEFARFDLERFELHVVGGDFRGDVLNEPCGLMPVVQMSTDGQRRREADQLLGLKSEDAPGAQVIVGEQLEPRNRR